MSKHDELDSKKRHSDELLTRYYEDDLATNKPFLDYFTKWKGEMGKFKLFILSLIVLQLPPELCPIVIAYVGLVDSIRYPSIRVHTHIMDLCNIFANVELSYYELEFFSHCFETVCDEVVVVQSQYSTGGTKTGNIQMESFRIQIGSDVFDTGRIATDPDSNGDDGRLTSPGVCSFSPDVQTGFNVNGNNYYNCYFWNRVRYALQRSIFHGDAAPAETSRQVYDDWDHDFIYTRFQHLPPRQLLILLMVNRMGQTACHMDNVGREEGSGIHYEVGVKFLEIYFEDTRPLSETLLSICGEMPMSHRKKFKSGPTLELAVDAAQSAAAGGTLSAVCINVD